VGKVWHGVGTRAVQAGEIYFAKTHPLRRRDGEEMPFAGHAL
jgi:hypothetical protein